MDIKEPKTEQELKDYLNSERNMITMARSLRKITIDQVAGYLFTNTHFTQKLIYDTLQTECNRDYAFAVLTMIEGARKMLEMAGEIKPRPVKRFAPRKTKKKHTKHRLVNHKPIEYSQLVREVVSTVDNSLISRLRGLFKR